VRPLDNVFLEKLIYNSRAVGGQDIIPKKNAYMALSIALKKGKSLGILPDQHTGNGIAVNFFGRKAATTPIPALLATTHKRPIVVVACCRKSGAFRFEGFVSDPIWPGEYESEKEEIFRLTREMTREMESIIRKYPEQYFWIHNRWKYNKNSKEVSFS
jgi:KDO2-lipid IV(A) lauroyltransferase